MTIVVTVTGVCDCDKYCDCNKRCDCIDCWDFDESSYCDECCNYYEVSDYDKCCDCDECCHCYKFTLSFITSSPLCLISDIYLDNFLFREI